MSTPQHESEPACHVLHARLAGRTSPYRCGRSCTFLHEFAVHLRATGRLPGSSRTQRRTPHSSNLHSRDCCRSVGHGDMTSHAYAKASFTTSSSCKVEEWTDHTSEWLRLRPSSVLRTFTRQTRIGLFLYLLHVVGYQDVANLKDDLEQEFDMIGEVRRGPGWRLRDDDHYRHPISMSWQPALTTS